jgi:hypothetical protein
MEIDFHFGVTYAVARLAGFGHEQSEIIATSSQYIDDTVHSGVVQFKTGESFKRINTAHDFLDYKITDPVEERNIWVPFHFLPGNLSEGKHKLDFYNRIVCRPNSEIAKEMCRSCITHQDKPYGLYLLGITAHVFIDTWAHQGFSGIAHKVNIASKIKLLNPKDDDRYFWKLMTTAGVFSFFTYLLRHHVSKLTGRFLPLGHGAVLHYPDHPFRVWSYTNGYGETVHRDNPKDFLEALNELYKFFKRYKLSNFDAPVEGLSLSELAFFKKKILENTDDDGEIRNEVWIKAINDGEFSFGVAYPVYSIVGESSWKYQALGKYPSKFNTFKTFHYSSAFLTSHWKLFHDAALTHQHEVIRNILPQFGICVI